MVLVLGLDQHRMREGRREQNGSGPGRTDAAVTRSSPSHTSPSMTSEPITHTL